LSSAVSHIDTGAFRKACALFATGVSVATVRAADGTPHGLTVSSFTSVSIEPPLVLVCIDYSCAFLPHFRAATKFAINVLSETQRDISVAFAEKPEGRFDGLEWYSNLTGAPLLRDCLATLECRVSTIAEAGDHAIFLGEVLHAESRPGKPLLYFDRDYRALR
jgi:flavin reductase (DIM6/NTAB) family NADH-FMN oxidoreductase RutF